MKRLLSLFDLRDLHVYGGGLLVAGGAGVLIAPPAFVIVFGLLLIYLGLRRP